MGLFDKVKGMLSSENNFTYLNDLIHSETKEIVLNTDIKLNEKELSTFRDGITLDVDNLIIDGNGFSIDGIGKTRFFNITGKNIVLKNISFINGRADYGGAIFLDGGSCLFKNCNFKNNIADEKGGAVYLALASSSFEDCSFEANSARYDGGTLLVYGGSCIIQNSIFNNNDAYAGGGVFNKGSLLLKDSKFYFNVSKFAGGAISNYAKSAKIDVYDCEFIYNSSGNQGGAIFNGLGELSLEKTVLRENTIGNVGSPAGDNLMELLLQSISANNSSSDISNVGGAIYNNATLKLSNCNLIKNSAPIAGAILNFNDGIYIDLNSHFDENKASQIAGAIFNFGNFESNGSIFSNNFSPAAGAIGANENSSSKIVCCIFHNNESTISSLGNMEIYNSEFRGNKSSSLPGSAITNGGKMRIEESFFSKNNNENNGGTIANSGDAELSGLTFVENVANFASAIYNMGSGSLKIDKSNFSSNNSRDHSTVLNSGAMVLKDSEFIGNFAKNAASDIFNENQMKIFESKFSETVNFESNNILNSGSLEIFSSEFIKNNSNSIIWNENEAFLSVLACQFKDNVSLKTSIFNESEKCTIDNPVFDNNSANEEFCHNVLNESILSLNNPIFKNTQCIKTVLNNGTMDIRKLTYDEIRENIHNNGKINNLTYPSDEDVEGKKPVSDEIDSDRKSDVPFVMGENDASNYNSFESLNDLINEDSPKGEVILSQDYKLEAFEIDFYSGGIELDKDDLTIDGRNHIIDGLNSSRIFYIMGKNITLKNIVFKNGNFETTFDKNINGGGALRTVKGSSLNLENCIFLNNNSNVNGGAIFNNGILNSINSSFTNNCSDCYGASIYNGGKMELEDDVFNDSSSRFGEDIYNEGMFILNDLSFNKNMDKDFKVILNNGFISDNSSNGSNMIFDIGVICNSFADEDELKSIKDLYHMINDSDKIKLKNDFAFDESVDNDFNDGIKITKDLVIDGQGHSIDIRYMDSIFDIGPIDITFENITFKNANASKKPLFINNGILTFKNCRFNNNKLFNKFGLIENINSLKILDCSFSKNSLEKNSIIDNRNRLEIKDSIFLNNSSFKSLIINNDVNARMEMSSSLVFDNDIISQSAILSREGHSKICESEFKFNSSNKGGGSIVNCSNSSMSIENCLFSDNNAEYGGAISNLGEMELMDSTLIKNKVKFNLGGALSNSGNLIIGNSIFSLNYARNGASAINSSGGILNIYNSCFNQNESKNDGIIIINETKLNMDSCKLENNIPSDDIIHR